MLLLFLTGILSTSLRVASLRHLFTSSFHVTSLRHFSASPLCVTIYPSRYDKKYGDPYFNTREQTFTMHLFYLMTRWMSLAHVHWVRPQQRFADESVVDFANRVKALISEKAGLTNLSWDGYLKNYRPTTEKQAQMRSQTRQEYRRELQGKLARLRRAGDDCRSQSPDKTAGQFDDCLPGWLSDESRTTIQNELMRHDCTDRAGDSQQVSRISVLRRESSDTWRSSPSPGGADDVEVEE